MHAILTVRYPMHSPHFLQSLELGVQHTVAFVLFASVMLLLLFYFDLNLVVTLLFCVSATTATSAIFILPALRNGRACLHKAGLLWNGEHVMRPDPTHSTRSACAWVGRPLTSSRNHLLSVEQC